MTTMAGGECSASLVMMLQMLPLVLVLVLLRDLTSLSLTQGLVSGFCLLLLLAGRVPHLTHQLTQSQERAVSSLSWSQYWTTCLHQDLSLGERVTCHQLTGLQVQWTGELHSLEMSERSNKVETLLNILPDTVREWTNADCVLGDR